MLNSIVLDNIPPESLMMVLQRSKHVAKTNKQHKVQQLCFDGTYTTHCFEKSNTEIDNTATQNVFLLQMCLY
jgi:hypothetical protein